MGAYLSKPVTDKESYDEIGDRLICGASSMQGWRKTQEDAHTCILNYDTNTSLFAVYDGHGGHDVAIYSAQHLPEYLKKREEYKNGDYTQALKTAFLEFDATLITPEVSNILKEIAKNKNHDSNSTSAEEEEVEENVKNLYEEAEMPLEQVIAKYKNDLLNSTSKAAGGEDKAGSSGASSSGIQSSSSNCSKSQISESKKDSDDKKEEEKDEASDSSSSSSSKQTKSVNGESKSIETVETGSGDCKEKSGDDLKKKSGHDLKEKSGGDSKEKSVDDLKEKSGGDSKEKSVDDLKEKSRNDVTEKSVGDEKSVDKISNKSEDIKAEIGESGDDKNKDSKVKKDKLGDEKSLGVEVNGEIGDEEKKEVNGDVVESEEGKEKERPRISASLRRRCANALYRTLLEAQENSDSDSDDEGDESFQGAENSSDEDDDDGDEEEENENAEEEGEEEEEETMLDDEEDDDDDESPPTYRPFSEKAGIDSGCTAVVALLKGQELYVGNAGDSRCVVSRKGHAIEMSLDHKPEDEIERNRIVKAGGRINSDGRVNGGLNLSRALGDHAYKKNSKLPAEEQMITALPDVRTLMIDPAEDEFMILACDGIWNSLSSQEVVDFVRERIQKGETKMSKICEELFDHCLAPEAHDLGDGVGCDNMTAVIVQFRPEVANSSESKSLKRAVSPPAENERIKRSRTEETIDV